MDLAIWLDCLVPLTAGHISYASLLSLVNPCSSTQTQQEAWVMELCVTVRRFYGVWPESRRHYSITALKLYPIVAAVVTWRFRGRIEACVSTRMTKHSFRSLINQQTSPEKTIMTLLRKLALRCLFFNILFRAKYIAGRDNTLADKLSRFQISEFRETAPWATEHHTMIPHHISPAGLGEL